MLKLKATIDFSDLKKFGFHRSDDGIEWYFDFREYQSQNYSYLCIPERNREIEIDYVDYDDLVRAVDLLFDLIQAGLVIKC